MRLAWQDSIRRGRIIPINPQSGEGLVAPAAGASGEDDVRNPAAGFVLGLPRRHRQTIRQMSIHRRKRISIPETVFDLDIFTRDDPLLAYKIG
jgi:hypothetical protein